MSQMEVSVCGYHLAHGPPRLSSVYAGVVSFVSETMLFFPFDFIPELHKLRAARWDQARGYNNREALVCWGRWGSRVLRLAVADCSVLFVSAASVF